MVMQLKKFHYIAVLIVLFAFLPLMSFAAGDSMSTGSLISSVTQVNTVLEKFVTWMYNIFWILAVGFIIWAAYLFLSAGDNTDQIEKAKKMLLYALIAAATVLVANGIEAIVANLISTS